MAQLGQWLRETREAKGLTLTDVETATRIRLSYLEALEAEDFDRLPGDVYARGFLRNYAQMLGLKPEEALAHYAELRGAPPARPTGDRLRLDEPVAVSLHAADRTWRWARLILVILILAAGGVTAWWLYRTYGLPRLAAPAALAQPTPEATATVPQPQAVVQAPTPTATLTLTPTPVLTLTPAPADTDTPVPTATSTETPTITPTPTPKVYRGVEIGIEITERSWLQVIVDGVKAFEGSLDPGDKRSWEGAERVLLRTGNAGGILVTLNGEALGPFGQVGEVKDREWIKQEPTAVG